MEGRRRKRRRKTIQEWVKLKLLAKEWFFCEKLFEFALLIS